MIHVAPLTVVPPKSVCTSATARFATVASSSARKAAPAATASTLCVVRGTAIAAIAHLVSLKKARSVVLCTTHRTLVLLSRRRMDAESLETLARTESVADDEADGRRRRGNATRESILQAAADLASVEGLEGLTIGRLATELNRSKGGLFAHFGSRGKPKLATIEAARRRFVDHVVRPSRHLPRGRARLEALLEDWLKYFRAEVFTGGWFFFNNQAEVDNPPHNPGRDIVAQKKRQIPPVIQRENPKGHEARRPRP